MYKFLQQKENYEQVKGELAIFYDGLPKDEKTSSGLSLMFIIILLTCLLLWLIHLSQNLFTLLCLTLLMLLIIRFYLNVKALLCLCFLNKLTGIILYVNKKFSPFEHLPVKSIIKI